MSRINKTENFLTLCRVIAQRSHDPRTQVGAVVVGPDGEIRSTGFNGLPRGFKDDDPDRLVAPEKYKWFVHAEMNAILNAVRVGVSLKDCDLYITICPCFECAKAIVQAGIKRVIVDEHLSWEFNRYLKQSGNSKHDIDLSYKILKEGYVQITKAITSKDNPNKIKIGGRHV